MFNLTYSSKEGLQMVYTTWSPKIEKLHYSLTLSALPESHFSARLAETNPLFAYRSTSCRLPKSSMWLRCSCHFAGAQYKKTRTWAPGVDGFQIDLLPPGCARLLKQGGFSGLRLPTSSVYHWGTCTDLF